MVEQSNDVSYNKIEHGLNGILSDCYQQEACEISICKNLEYQMTVVNM